MVTGLFDMDIVKLKNKNSKILKNYYFYLVIYSAGCPRSRIVLLR